MFYTCLSVIHFMGEGVSVLCHFLSDRDPPDRDPLPGQKPPWTDISKTETPRHRAPLDRDPCVRPFRLDDMDASRGITLVVILWVTSHKRIWK